jgi:hypothetical protein
VESCPNEQKRGKGSPNQGKLRESQSRNEQKGEKGSLSRGKLRENRFRNELKGGKGSQVGKRIDVGTMMTL